MPRKITPKKLRKALVMRQLGAPPKWLRKEMIRRQLDEPAVSKAFGRDSAIELQRERLEAAQALLDGKPDITDEQLMKALRPPMPPSVETGPVVYQTVNPFAANWAPEGFDPSHPGGAAVQKSAKSARDDSWLDIADPEQREAVFKSQQEHRPEPAGERAQRAQMLDYIWKNSADPATREEAALALRDFRDVYKGDVPVPPEPRAPQYQHVYLNEGADGILRDAGTGKPIDPRAKLPDASELFGPPPSGSEFDTSFRAGPFGGWAWRY